jgi:hypothetical protein
VRVGAAETEAVDAGATWPAVRPRRQCGRYLDIVWQVNLRIESLEPAYCQYTARVKVGFGFVYSPKILGNYTSLNR